MSICATANCGATLPAGHRYCYDCAEELAFRRFEREKTTRRPRAEETRR